MSGDCVVCECLCRGSSDLTQFKSVGWDLLVLSECVYLEDTFDALLYTMYELCTLDTVVILGYIKRRKADNKFWKKAEKLFTWHKV